jgi:hypothetical protein
VRTCCADVLSPSEVLTKVEFAYMFIEVSVHTCLNVCIILCNFFKQLKWEIGLWHTLKNLFGALHTLLLDLVPETP